MPLQEEELVMPMETINNAVAWVQREPGAALMGAAGLYLLMLILLVIALFRLTRLGRLQAQLLRGADGMNLEQLLVQQGDTLQEMAANVSTATAMGRSNADTVRYCLQKVGLVRYDAFANVGGEQSFSVALLDNEGNGVVLSGLYARNEVRVYAKPVVGGASPLALSDEERDAINRSRVGGPEAQAAGERERGSLRR